MEQSSLIQVVDPKKHTKWTEWLKNPVFVHGGSRIGGKQEGWRPFNMSNNIEASLSPIRPGYPRLKLVM